MVHRLRVSSAALVLASATCLLFAAEGCSSDDDGSGGAGTGTGSGASSGATMSGTASGGGGSSGTNTGSANGGSTGSFGTTGSGGQPPCATQSAEATITKKPVDIIILIDNSGSMTGEIQGVEQNINQNFATIIEDSGLDYRVILVSRHGKASAGQSICVEAPLSGIPAGGCATPPAQPVNNPPHFYHYSTEVASRDSWCKILNTFDKPDEFNLAPNGWQDWLRPDSFKTFIEITDDGVGCSYNGHTYQDSNNVANGTTAAALFDTDLLALSPASFGDATERNYQFYSIVALGYNTPPTAPYTPADPVITTKCPTAANAGTGHQALSVLTNSLRFPICDTTSYDVVFQAIANGVIDGAKVDCAFPVPDPPTGQTIDLNSVVVQYTPNMGGVQQFMQVSGAGACAPNSFYIENDTIQLCDATCDLVQADDEAKIDVLFDCAGMLN